ncbi:MAG TPA: hypothetical protein VD886_25600, partial [Herpetosiphonaceae bacterium]|nr:hypothetical protein [Herpetosiphonaceae bacterium]
QVPALYDAADIERGYLAREDHYHVMRQIPLQTVSIGVVTTKNNSLTSYHDISRVAAEMKNLAKRQSGSVYVIDRRSRKLAVSPERRKQRPMVYVLGADTVLKAQVLASLGAQTLVLGTDLPGPDSLRPDFVVLVGQPEAQPTRDLAAIWPDLPIIAVTPDEAAATAPATLSVRLAMNPKVPLGEYLALAMHLLRLEAR